MVGKCEQSVMIWEKNLWEIAEELRGLTILIC